MLSSIRFTILLTSCVFVATGAALYAGGLKTRADPTAASAISQMAKAGEFARYQLSDKVALATQAIFRPGYLDKVTVVAAFEVSGEESAAHLKRVLPQTVGGAKTTWQFGVAERNEGKLRLLGGTPPRQQLRDGFKLMAVTSDRETARRIPQVLSEKQAGVSASKWVRYPAE